jgi:hypothetical protein
LCPVGQSAGAASSVEVLKNLILDTAHFLVVVFGSCGFGDFEAVLDLRRSVGLMGNAT